MAAHKKIALLGAGYIADWHAAAIKRVRGASLHAVCDLSEAAANGFASAHNVLHVFTDLEELLAHGACDCVHVLTPPHAHGEATRKILEAGLSAFVEKPFSLSSQECRELDVLAREKNLALGVNHNFLMLPSYDRLKRDLARGVIGPIDTFEVNWQFPLPPLRSGPFGLWMLRRPENILFEIGPHLFAFVADLFGELSDIDVDLRHPIDIPGGARHYQSWRITGRAGQTSVTLNLSLIEGEDNRCIRLRGLGALASYDFSQDSYTRVQTDLQDIVIGPFARQLARAGHALRDGVVNAARQGASLNALAPYGLSMTRAIDAFYRSANAGASQDKRLSASLGAATIAMAERCVEKARPKFTAPPRAVIASPPTNGKAALVIGGTGFIGRALVKALEAKGYDIRVFTRGSGAGLAQEGGRVSIFSGSLHSDEDLREAMQGVDVVFHLARAAGADWKDYLENDVGVTRRIGEACLSAGVGRLVYTGTIDSYDASQADRPVSEETPFDAELERRNLYARSKAMCEAALQEIAREKGLPLVITRPGIVIGPGGPLQHWGVAMWRGSTACKLWGDGRNILPFVLVDDVADGLVLAGEVDDALGRSFNLIGEPMLSAREYFEEVGKANNVAMRARPAPLWTYYVIDVAKYWAKRILARRKNLTQPSFRDWQSRAQLSPFKNDLAKTALDWRPEDNREEFIRRGVREANLFGLIAPSDRAQSQESKESSAA